QGSPRPAAPLQGTAVRRKEAPAARAAAQGNAALRQAEWSAPGLARHLGINLEEVQLVARQNRLRVPHGYLALVQGGPEDPIWRQCVPSQAELAEGNLEPDPLAEDAPRNSPTPHLTHRYPDRALLLVTDLCPMFCRFCMRKRKTLAGAAITSRTVEQGIAHIAATPAIREVILSGGDPLMLPDARLAHILTSLRAIPHVQVLRVHTRMPCVEPRRVTPALAKELARHQPLHVGVHFNHPREVTTLAAQALATLVDAGLPVHNQSVLLKGVNDDAALLASLFRKLLRCRVHPYYLHHADLVPGTAHFRTTVQRGLQIVNELRTLAPELAMLHYVLDTPGGGGKVPLSLPTDGRQPPAPIQPAGADQGEEASRDGTDGC
ncbi:MAG TPA: KamA family radical SAM protein, partial [bacterium]|nr:KamA family radical SAM protein [bacterium]